MASELSLKAQEGIHQMRKRGKGTEIRSHCWYQAQTWGELATSWAWSTGCRRVEAVVEVEAEKELDREGFAHQAQEFVP